MGHCQSFLVLQLLVQRYFQHTAGILDSFGNVHYSSIGSGIRHSFHSVQKKNYVSCSSLLEYCCSSTDAIHWRDIILWNLSARLLSSVSLIGSIPLCIHTK